MLRHDHALKTLLGLTGSCELLRVEGRALEGNALGDPSIRYLPVYLPPRTDELRVNGLPTLYYLPSFGADARAVIAGRPWEETLFQRVDRLIAGGVMRPLIIVAVDGWTRLGGSQYVDSVHNGAYAQFLLHDVIAAAEQALPVATEPRTRGIFGKSSGGFGALHLALRYPGHFGALAAHSADGYFPYAAQPAFAAAFRELRKFDFDCAAFTAQFEQSATPSRAAHETIITLAYAAAYSPNSARAFDFALPFSTHNGLVDDDVFARWLEFDPVYEVRNAAKRAALEELALCYLDCGNHDEFALDIAGREIAAQMSGAASVIYEEYGGGHRGNSERYDRSLGLLCDAVYKAVAA